MHTQITGIAWFRREDYAAFRRLIPGRNWHATYDEWLRAVEQHVQRLERSGMRVVKADVQSDAFAQWCAGLGIHVDSAALVRHANEYALRHLTQHGTN